MSVRIEGGPCRDVFSNIFQHVVSYGKDDLFVPIGSYDFAPTEAPAGSNKKIDVMIKRVELGNCLYHPEDSRNVLLKDDKLEVEEATEQQNTDDDDSD